MESVPLTSSLSSPRRPVPLLRSFAIFCPSLSRDREELAEDNTLFYHPFGDHKNRQLNQVGFCIAVSCLCARFSGVPPKARSRRRGPATAETREHEIQCRDRVISLVNPFADIWIAAELSTPLAVDRSTVQLAMSRCFDLFAMLYGRAAVQALLIPPSSPNASDTAAASQSRAALHAHCVAFVAYFEARLCAAADGAVMPHVTLMAPVLDITTPNGGHRSDVRGSPTSSKSSSLSHPWDRLVVISETAKERLHFIVKSSLRRFCEVVAPDAVDFDVTRARRHGQTSWETLTERRRAAPPVRSIAGASFPTSVDPAAARAEQRRSEAATRVLWVLLCQTQLDQPPASRLPPGPLSSASGRPRAAYISRTYTMAVASECFPRRLLALLTAYLDVYGVPSREDRVPCYLSASSASSSADGAAASRAGPSHWLLCSQSGDMVALCVVPVAAMQATPAHPGEAAVTRWTAWVASISHMATEYVRADGLALTSSPGIDAGGLVNDAALVVHGADVSQREMRLFQRLSVALRPPSLLASTHLRGGRDGAPLGSWLVHGQAVVHGPSPATVPPLVWRTIIRLVGYVRDKKATSSAARPPPACLWLPCGAYRLALAVAATDADGADGDMLVSVFHASQRLDQCFISAHALSTALLF